MAQRLEVFRGEFDHLRTAIVCEPRGHSAIVGALLCEPVNEGSTAGVIYFNNVGYLGMCGHGTIGLIKTLEHMGRIGAGVHRIDTPVGTVAAELDLSGFVTITSVPSYRFAKNIAVDVEGYGQVVGDIAYGGNWFFLTSGYKKPIEFADRKELTEFAVAIRDALSREGLTGEARAEIDHIEIFGDTPNADSRNFVLCPGFEYDRSPCGTGTSAKMACLYADGKLKEGDIWRQESIIGSIFEGRIRIQGEKVVPIIRGDAHITAEADLMINQSDPYRFGIT